MAAVIDILLAEPLLAYDQLVDVGRCLLPVHLPLLGGLAHRGGSGVGKGPPPHDGMCHLALKLAVPASSAPQAGLSGATCDRRLRVLLREDGQPFQRRELFERFREHPEPSC